MNEIWAYAAAQLNNPTDDDIRAWLHKYRLDITAGCFNFRPNTSDPTKLSLHSYGIAIDWDPLHNPRKKPMTKSLPDWWYDIWVKHGWSDGRHFHTPDPMHVQFATGA
ncbi:M15 family metallopeptidase [Mucilaginibacter sp. ZT4R22]|uniref:M15 family metallopeptidase n=1 Tax=Mucilaginibacter pankratovii TaxID=2772110 RepID=A0ABR7WKI2_9SPHI|nr:M15 family metallopeptidase [Mucilaginibacter pankratovii]MBD1362830.1 M15 family metallopeptidase [Mucilaginibacter pankratovii]